jgi:signal transduction histidine kinase
VGKQVRREPELHRGDIRECAEQALHEIAPLADDKHISISLNLEGESGPLFFEPGKIEQVLINLLENACKFTPRAGEIEIRGYPHFWERRRHNLSEPDIERRHRRSREPNSYRVDICDSGPRIAQEHLSKIFEEYTSYGGGNDRSGGGLGLAICKMILTSHGGRVWAENSDAGPRISFVLPIRAVDALATETGAASVWRAGQAARSDDDGENGHAASHSLSTAQRVATQAFPANGRRFPTE